MLDISDWAAAELTRLLPQAEALIKRTGNVYEANVRRRLLKMAKYLEKNAERKQIRQKRVGETAQKGS